MVYDSDLADRVRAVIGTEPGLTEKRMFGGLAFLVHGNMAVAASRRGGLMLRVEPARTGELLQEPGTRPMEMRGRDVAGWLRVEAAAVADEDELRDWVRRGVEYARSLPAK